MRESIFTSSMRSFFFALFAAMGLGIALIPIGFIWSGISAMSEARPQNSLSPVALPNAQGRVLTSGKDNPLILQIDINGVIGAKGLTKKDVSDQLIASQEGLLSSGRVKGILLAINSGGGSAFDSDGIFRLLQEYKERHKIPVFAMIDGLCASGGVYISCAADKIYASQTSSIGSVGVISRDFNYSKLASMIGIEGFTLFEGKGKDECNPWRPWKEDEGENRRRLIRHFYQRFVDVVTKARSIDPDVLKDEIGASIYPAPEALTKNFIDQIEDSRAKCLEDLARAGQVDPKLCAILQFQPKLWLRDLLSVSSSGHHRIEHELLVPGISDRCMAFDPAGIYYQLKA